MKCRILVPCAGMEFVSPAVELWSPSPWIAREVPSHILKTVRVQLAWGWCMGWPREMLWGGRWEGGSCLGTHVRIKDFKIKKNNKKLKKKINKNSWLGRLRVCEALSPLQLVDFSLKVSSSPPFLSLKFVCWMNRSLSRRCGYSWLHSCAVIKHTHLTFVFHVNW